MSWLDNLILALHFSDKIIKALFGVEDAKSSNSKTEQSYWRRVQPGAWWPIQRTGGPSEELDKAIDPSIDSIPAS